MEYYKNSSGFRSIARKMLPGWLRRFITGFFYGWGGNYRTWEEALSECTGYNDPEIVRKVVNATQLVRDGKAAFERDSVTYEEAVFNFPVITAVLLAATQKSGKLNILDFGGSLGSTYFQNKVFLDTIADLNWCIVEQENFVRTGIERFSDDRLHFYYSVDDCINANKIDLVIFSSVLQYLENPFSFIEKIVEQRIRYIIIDRTPFVDTKSRITVQKVHPSIYRASYPCWFFNESQFLSYFKKHYVLMSQFTALDVANIRSVFKGFILRLND